MLLRSVETDASILPNDQQHERLLLTCSSCPNTRRGVVPQLLLKTVGPEELCEGGRTACPSFLLHLSQVSNTRWSEMKELEFQTLWNYQNQTGIHLGKESMRAIRLQCYYPILQPKLVKNTISLRASKLFQLVMLFQLFRRVYKSWFLSKPWLIRISWILTAVLAFNFY